MDVQHKEEGPGVHSLSVTIEADVVERTYDAALRQVARGVRLAGFRPGHAPLATVARLHAAEIGDQVRQHLVERTLPQALGDARLSPVARPAVSAGEVRPGALFTYTARIEVLPPVVLAKVEGLELRLPAGATGEGSVADELERQRQQDAEMRPVQGREEVAAGDAVTVDIDAKGADGRPVAELRARQLLLDTGDTHLIDGLAAGVIGARVPGSVRVEVTLPPHYRPEHLAGRVVVLAVKLHELKERFLPPLDDALAQDHGHADLATWRAAAEKELAGRAQQARDGARQEAAVAALVAANPVAVPEGLVALEVDQTLEAMLSERGVNGRQLPAELTAELRRNLMGPARDRLAAGLLVEQVAKERDIAASEAAIDADIETRVSAAGEEATRVRASFADPERRERLRAHLVQRAVVAHLLAHCTEGPPPLPPSPPQPTAPSGDLR